MADEFKTIDRLTAASAEEIAAVRDIGPIIAESVASFLGSEHGKTIIKDLRNEGVVLEAEQTEDITPIFEGKTFVVTGTLTKYSRDEIKDLITRYGGRASFKRLEENRLRGRRRKGGQQARQGEGARRESSQRRTI